MIGRGAHELVGERRRSLLAVLANGVARGVRLFLHVCAIPFRPLPRATIGTQITLLTLVTTLPFLVLIIAWSVQDTQGARQQAEQSLRTAGQLSAATLQAQLQTAEAQVHATALAAAPTADVTANAPLLWLHRLDAASGALPATAWQRAQAAAASGQPVAAGPAAPTGIAAYVAAPVPGAAGELIVGAVGQSALTSALSGARAGEDALAVVDSSGTTVVSSGNVVQPGKPDALWPVAGTDWRVVGSLAAGWPSPDVTRSILGLLWATIAAVCLGVLSHRRLSVPIVELASTARRIGRGEFRVRAPFERGDELGELADAMNAMTANLEELTGELRAARDRLVNTIAEVGRLATSGLDAEEFWPLLAEIIQHLSGADGSALYVREGGGALRLAATSGLAVWPARGDLAHRLAREVDQGWDAAPVWADRRMAVPIHVNQETAGVLEIFRVDGPFPPGADRLLAVFARQAGLAIERTYLRRQAAEALVWEQATRTQNEFIAFASHELCAPMASLRSYAEALRLPEVLDDEQERTYCLERVEHLSERLGDIVRNLLSVSRIRSGQLRVRPRGVDAAELLRGCVADTQRRAPRVRFAVVAPPALPLAQADPVCLEEIVLNLLSNAIRYTPESGTVEVCAEAAVGEDGLRLRLRVRDEGPGLSREQQERLFQRFGRLNPDEGGTGLGLGLYICQAYAKAMQGSIWVASEPGQGAAFTVDLPAALHADGGQVGAA